MKRQKGFTLIEVLVALAIATAILSPMTLWFYNTGVNRLAWQQHQGIQLCRLFLNRAYLEGWEHSKEVLDPILGDYQLRIEVKKISNEIQYYSQLKTKSGKEICQLNISRFMPDLNEK